MFDQVRPNGLCSCMGTALLLQLALRHGKCQIAERIVNIEMETIMEIAIIAVCISKKVLQLTWVEMDIGCFMRLQLKRAKIPE